MTTKKIILTMALAAACGMALTGCRPTSTGPGRGSAPVARNPIPEYWAEARQFESNTIAVTSRSEKPRLITVDGFHSKTLDNSRALYVYLPPNYYADPAISYPVLYVQDGKAAFYDSDWSKESLAMHLTAEALIEAGSIEALVIVGISNAGEQRASEYAHWDGVDWGKAVQGRGAAYEDFLLSEVMPFIEANFRIKHGRDHTAIMGASLGGLAAFNIAMRHPETFSKVAAQSPFLGWGNRRLFEELIAGDYREKRDLRIWLDISAEESGFKIDLDTTVDILVARGHVPGSDLEYRIDPKGRHSEGSWATRVKDILLFLYGIAKETTQ